MQTITTFLTFKERAEEAVDFYVSLFPNSKIISKMPHEGKLLHAAFELDGQRFMAMDGGDTFEFSHGISLFVTCQTQEEIDHYWDALTADGGQQGQCGWLTDKFGVSWQIIPQKLGEFMSDPEPAKAQATMQAMLNMKKIIIANLETAHDSA